MILNESLMLIIEFIKILCYLWYGIIEMKMYEAANNASLQLNCDVQ